MVVMDVGDNSQMLVTDVGDNDCVTNVLKLSPL